MALLNAAFAALFAAAAFFFASLASAFAWEASGLAKFHMSMVCSGGGSLTTFHASNSMVSDELFRVQHHGFDVPQVLASASTFKPVLFIVSWR